MILSSKDREAVIQKGQGKDTTLRHRLGHDGILSVPVARRDSRARGEDTETTPLVEVDSGLAEEASSRCRSSLMK